MNREKKGRGVSKTRWRWRKRGIEEVSTRAATTTPLAEQINRGHRAGGEREKASMEKWRTAEREKWRTGGAEEACRLGQLEEVGGPEH